MTNTDILTKLEIFRRELVLLVNDGNFDEAEAENRFFTEVERVSSVDEWAEFQDSGEADLV